MTESTWIETSPGRWENATRNAVVRRVSAGEVVWASHAASGRVIGTHRIRERAMQAAEYDLDRREFEAVAENLVDFVETLPTDIVNMTDRQREAVAEARTEMGEILRKLDIAFDV